MTLQRWNYAKSTDTSKKEVWEIFECYMLVIIALIAVGQSILRRVDKNLFRFHSKQAAVFASLASNEAEACWGGTG